MDALSTLMAQSWETLSGDNPGIEMAVFRHRTTRNTAMSFKMMPSTIELAIDFFKPDFEGADIEAATQTGKTDILTQVAWYNAGWRGRTVAYVLPTVGKRNDFVHRRVEEPHELIPEYSRMVLKAQMRGKAKGRKKKATKQSSLRMRRFGLGRLQYLSAATPSDFSEFSADCMILDEYDECLAWPKNVKKAWNRLRNAPDKQLFRIANPHMEDWGIDELFKQGDGRLFHWKCLACNERQPLEWYDNIVHRKDDGSFAPRDAERARDLILSGGVGPDIRPVCRNCHRPFERDPYHAAWVAERPGRRRSYRMTRLDVLLDRLWDLWIEFQKCKGRRVDLEEFSSGALGKPHSSGGMRLTTAMLEKLCVGGMNKTHGDAECNKNLQVMGVDVGGELNVQIDRVHRHPSERGEITRETICLLTTPSFDEVIRLIDSFKVSVAAFDADPETRKVKEVMDWARKKRDRSVGVWACRFFPTARVGQQAYGMELDYGDRSVRADRTQLLDSTFDEIAQEERAFPMDARSIDGWIDQMKAPKRVLSDRGDRYVWDEGEAADHYRLADSYARIAADISQMGAGFSAG